MLYLRRDDANPMRNGISFVIIPAVEKPKAETV